jgi:sirohydrochlorin ferrochelatase
MRQEVAMRDILLIDNGSKRADATLSLRGIAARLRERVGREVHPVSLLHADQVPASALGGRPADTLEPFLRRRLAAGVRSFLLLPLFFGPSRAISDFIPDLVERLRAEHGPLATKVARELCPLPEGEPRLTEILLDQLRIAANAAGVAPRRVVLVDHGSPLPAVTAVRAWLAVQLAARLGPTTLLQEAVMERRPGAEYDFNGELLQERLSDLASAEPLTPVILAMLFLSPGRHAGAGGDIDAICRHVELEHPGFRAYPSSLIGSHPALIDILAERLRESEDEWTSR